MFAEYGMGSRNCKWCIAHGPKQDCKVYIHCIANVQFTIHTVILDKCIILAEVYSSYALPFLERKEREGVAP